MKIIYVIGFFCFFFWILFAFSFILYLGSNSNPGDVVRLGMDLINNHVVYVVVSFIFTILFVVKLIEKDKITT